jgi:hypothetical protein
MILSPLQLRVELAYRRHVLFAVELVDAVTLERVGQGIGVTAVGLRGIPVVNTRGFFVWFEEDFERLRRLSIDPGSRPYERVELTADQVQRPLTTVELPPRIDYPFATGVTGLRGTLIESRTQPPRPPEPVRDGEVRLRWFGEDEKWHDAPTATHADPRSGDFVSVLRFGPTEKPAIDATGELTVRLRVHRGDGRDRTSTDFKLRQGRVTDPSTAEPLTLAWDEMQP